jgi:hypothetical protein
MSNEKLLILEIQKGWPGSGLFNPIRSLQFFR